MDTDTKVDLRKVEIELVYKTLDIGRIETFLSRQHPLGVRKAQGKRLYYAAVHEGEWIAVLLFDGAVYRNKLRAAEIGWSAEQEKARREHVCNNSRFLVLSEYQGVKNLASKILSLVANRISADWMRRYGKSLLAMETYVDPEQNGNQGSCYLAAGWKELGISTGFMSSSGERTHGKKYFLKSLHEDSYAALRSEIPHALMTGVKPVSGVSNNNFVLDAKSFQIDDLKEFLSEIPDHRKAHGVRYPFRPFLGLCIGAVSSGYTQYRQISDWIRNLDPSIRRRFGFRSLLTPSEGAVSYFLRGIDPEKLQSVLSRWLVTTYPHIAESRNLCADGKALRGTDSETSKQVAVLNVFANDVGIVINQLETTKGGGEKVSAREFVEKSASLEGVHFIGDAMLTDKELIETLEKKS